MSASILYEPINPNPKSIDAWAPSSFMETMQRANIALPCTLGPDNIPILMGMAAVFGDKGDAPNPYQQLVDAINKYGKISVWAEY